MPWLILVSCLFLSSAPATKQSCSTCLPKEIQPEDVVSYQLAKPGTQKGKAITVADTLVTLKAHCKRGKLVDRSGRQIYFFHLQGCWGNPPADYQEILQAQDRELKKLKQRFTVVEMTCNPSGELIP